MMNYSKYTQQTQEYLKNVEAYLLQKYGSINPAWESTLILLADNIDLYRECQKAVNENGIFDADSYKKNPLLSTMKDLQASITKQIQHLGLSPYAESKIKIGQEDDTEDFIESLTE